MFRIHAHYVVAMVSLAAAFATSPVGARAPTVITHTTLSNRPDFSKLYTTYTFSTGYTSANLVVCGSTLYTEGCYGSASIGPFNHAGALIEGRRFDYPRKGYATREIYVVDDAAGAHETGVTLYVYTKTDTANSSDDTVTVKLTSTIPLPLTGGIGAKTFMAADDDYLFIGTDQSPFAVKLNKADLTYGQIGGFSPPVNVSSITTNDDGYVTVTFGSNSAESGFYTYGPDGNTVEDGGGADYMLDSSVGLSTDNVSTASSIAAPRLHVRLKPVATHRPIRG